MVDENSQNQHVLLDEGGAVALGQLPLLGSFPLYYEDYNSNQKDGDSPVLTAQDVEEYRDLFGEDDTDNW